MEGKIKLAVEKFLELHEYEIYDEDFGPIQFVAYDPEDEAVVFIFVVEGMDTEATADMRKDFEASVMCWLSENDPDDSVRIRLDVIGVYVIGNNKAFIKHHVNAGGYKGDDE